VQFQRLVIEAGRSAFGLNLHPGLTVIADIGPLEREGLVNDLLGAVGTGRSGVHLELSLDDDRHLAVFRPAGERPRVVDIDRSADVTAAYTDGLGELNLLAGMGCTTRSLRRRLVITSDDLAPRSTMEEWLLRLAHIDPHRLWDLAAKVRSREARLEEIAARTGGSGGDAELIEEIERRHHDLERSECRMERVRKATFMGAALAIVNAMSLLLLFGSLIWAAPLVLAAIVSTVFSARQWHRMNEARRAEDEVLEAVGASSYLAFQIAHVNGLVANDRNRTDLLAAAEYHAAAMAEWHLLVGDVPLDWAVEHRRDIETTAIALRNGMDVTNPMASTLTPIEETIADGARALRHHLVQLTRGGKTLPGILDDPLDGCESDAKARLLGLILDVARRQQVIYLTDDPEIAAWAQAHADDPAIGLVQPEVIASTGGDDLTRRRHAAA
jgi:hypothetical protein